MSLMQDTDPDLSTQSNYGDIQTTHVDFDWKVDFDTRTISGSIELTLKVKTAGLAKLLLDTSKLEIKGVTVNEEEKKFELDPPHCVKGSCLRIDLPPDLKSGAEVMVKIEYSTIYVDPTIQDVALQWLTPDQTVGKKHPYLFSQCQQIYARSLAPLQDTCAVKFTYTANVSAKYPILMSAPNHENDGKRNGKVIGKDSVTYTFHQHNPIPSYLLAIAVGDVEYRAFKVPDGKEWTSGVWTESKFLKKAHDEFSDIPQYLAAQETVVGPYSWKVYDLLVLPPSFPYGGMENPNMTFVTPALVVGDRSLVDVCIHELTHSWFGNGVTCTWAKHNWLNEGWTIYMERHLQERLYPELGPARRGLYYIIGEKELDTDWAAYSEPPEDLKYRKLVIDYTKDDDPDKGFSTIPYEKGGNFIFYLEKLLGPAKFLSYAREYADHYWGQSITTDQWKDHLYHYFRKDNEALEALKDVSWDAWLKGTMEQDKLPVNMEWIDDLAKPARRLAEAWNDSRGSSVDRLPFKATDLDKFDPEAKANQMLVFLDNLSPPDKPLPSDHIAHLDKLYGLVASNNAEICYRFYLLALKSEDAKEFNFTVAAASWVVGKDGTWVQGRMKYCRPIFRAINEVDPVLAKETFNNYGKYFHPIAQKWIKKDIGL